ncbi:MAG: aspartyl/asparaginyl beta-hydroxylase domain-containing protein [Alphaproteobacteria bacterium]|nr:aspartyl/asparaginyl beta-hydroxylase domain-containing protein [Alphaproteobacteria bacterium]
MTDKVFQLEQWALKKNIDKSKLFNVFQMLVLGKREERTENDFLQFPSYYIKDTHAKAWHAPQDYAWVKLLEKNFEEIKKEALKVFEENLMNAHPENDDLAGYGVWNTFFFYKNGAKYLKNHEKCPFTSSVLSKIVGVDIAGRTYFSAMPSGIHIKSHCGPHNFKLRTHLGIITPPEAVIRVANITKPWVQEKCIVFDDSFEHEVWNRSENTRIVLIVDVWNPCLSLEETMALEYIMPEFYEREEIV